MQSITHHSAMRTLPCLLVSGALALAANLEAASSSADLAFESLARAFVEDYLRMNPEHATQLGDHRYDNRLSDFTPEAIVARVELLHRYRAELDKVEVRSLTGANRIDVRMLALPIDAM